MLLVFCYLVPIFTLLFSKFLLSDSNFHASVFRVSVFPLQFSHFCFSGFNFPASFGASNFHASALSISCGNKCLFSNGFLLRNFGFQLPLNVTVLGAVRAKNAPFFD